MTVTVDSADWVSTEPSPEVCLHTVYTLYRILRHIFKELTLYTVYGEVCLHSLHLTLYTKVCLYTLYTLHCILRHIFKE